MTPSSPQMYKAAAPKSMNDWAGSLALENLKRRARTLKKQSAEDKAKELEELKKRKWAGSPTTRPMSPEGTSCSLPSSMPMGTTQCKRSGRGAPGTAGPAVSMPT